MPTIEQIAAQHNRAGWTVSQPVQESVWRVAGNIGETSGMQPTGAFTVTLTKPGFQPQTMTVVPDKDDEGGWRIAKPPEEAKIEATNTNRTSNVTGPDGTIYTVNTNPDGTQTATAAIAGKPSNPDADQSIAIKAQEDTALRNARERNLREHGFYVDDKTYSDITLAGQKNQIDQNQINAQLKIASDKNVLDNLALQNTINKTKSDIDLQGAQVGRIGAQNALDQAQIDALRAKTPAEIGEMEARGDLTRAQAAQFRATTANLDRPQQIASDTTAQFRDTFDPKTGKYGSQVNPNYAPKETGAQIAALQQAALAKQTELNQLVQQGQMQGAQAADQFNKWWDSTVEPRRQSIDQGQRQQLFENQIKAGEQQRQNMTTAQNAGSLAVQAYNASSKNMVGPGYEAAMQQILNGYRDKKMPSIDAKGLVWEGPSLQEISEKAVQQSLAGISPGAAAATGNPGGGGLQIPAGIDLATALDRTKYGFGGTGAVMAPSPGGGGGVPPVPAGGGGPVPAGGGVAGAPAPVMTAAPAAQAAQPDWYTEWRKRQNLDVADQRVQAGIGQYQYQGG